MEHIWKLQEFVTTTSKLDVDQTEFAYLKTIVLFSPGNLILGSVEDRLDHIRLTIVTSVLRI